LSTSDRGGFRRPEERRDQPLLNERIRDRELRVIDEKGEQVGIITKQEALQLSRERGLDLLIVQPDANPPVAKILDFHRFEFENKKRERENKKKHHIVDVKEIKLRYKIEEHDYQVKVKNGLKFLNNGDKIKVNMMLRGREMQHKQLAMDLLNRFASDLKDLGIVDKEPKLEGKSVIMIISPVPQKGKPALVEKDDTGAPTNA
jgi:translation initiation factor IF-3